MPPVHFRGAVVNAVSVKVVLPSLVTAPIASVYLVPAARKPSGTATAVVGTGRATLHPLPVASSSITTSQTLRFFTGLHRTLKPVTGTSLSPGRGCTKDVASGSL